MRRLASIPLLLLAGAFGYMAETVLGSTSHVESMAECLVGGVIFTVCFVVCGLFTVFAFEALFEPGDVPR